MNRLLPLVQREWLQHRFGWALMVLVPLGIALAVLGFGHIDVGGETIDKVGPNLPILLAMASMGGGTALIFLIAWVTSLIIVSGLARRDHGDRSIEFWLSMPTTHSASLGVPMAVHLLLVPAAALLAGLACGWLVSMVLVGRVVGLGAWFALPWPELAMATGSVALRLVAGLPLATLWLLPLILLIVLLTAWFKRWGWVILGVGMGLGSQLLEKVFGQEALSRLFGELLHHAAKALLSTPGGFNVNQPNDAILALRSMPGWLASDYSVALRDLASPLLAGGLVFAAGCFALLLLWRQRGAGAAG
jgi:hypothetical protein